MLIKVCCIQDEEEMFAAAAAGATHVGLVGAMPSGPGPLDDADIARIVRSAPPGVTTTLLTSRARPGAIVDHLGATGAMAVQVVRAVPPSVRRAIRRAVPRVEILQVVHVEGPASVEAAEDAAEDADYVLLDSGRPNARTPELGGTGRVHDWSVSAQIASRSPVPVLLAGGLGPSNVEAAIETVRPAGVDVCSGLRDSRGKLLSGLLEEFVGNAHAAAARTR